MKSMKCFTFSHGDKDGEPKTTKSTSCRSNRSMLNGQECRKSGSEFISMDMSDVSESSTRVSFTSLTQNPSGKSNNNLREFATIELKTATKNFNRALMIGEGGFGGVYRAVIRKDDGSGQKIDVAVKQLSRRGLQGHKEWVTEVNVLGFVDHPNLVKLVGYSSEDDERGIQRLLVYEYMPNRSVQDHLSNRFQTPLPWSTRLKIAQDAARGLAYLHEGMEFQIIFRDFKSSNILLDENWNAKLSDFGLARLGPSDGLGHVSTAVVGTVGYAAPEYVQTGRLTYKSDVWSFGVFLYELITGRRPMDRNKPKNEQKLLDWVRPHLSHDMRKFEKILDTRLAGNYSLKSAQKLAALANKCLLRQPRMRPKMSQVLEILNTIVADESLESLVEPSLCYESISTPRHGVWERSIREGLKRTFVGDNKWLVCLTSSPKVMSTS
ncbi:Protein kinase, ATP binding site-containing protein [Artemisia annua]|uniref:non-specific serine/threonine protein kinase n=1 Tax=Artemisia annua TaxID=35608 RepID=A0A2U1MZF5_ARTAN|nr:Protein kinase, ATP binding site-containing protein [Artemisia annua]